MGPNYKHDRLSSYFINLTSEAVRVYEYTSGQIWTFPPNTDSLPETPFFDLDTPLTHYIVEPEAAEKLRQSGRPLDDIAVISGSSIGRNDREIASLTWGKDPAIIVRLYRNFKKSKHD